MFRLARSTGAMGALFIGALLVSLVRPSPLVVHPAPNTSAGERQTEPFLAPAILAPAPGYTVPVSNQNDLFTQTPSAPVVSEDILYLRRVFMNFGRLSSFRADLQIPTDIGIATGSISFVKNEGMEGTLHLPNAIETHVRLRDGRVHFRTATSTWADITDQEDGKHIMALLEESLNLDDRVDAYIPSHAVVTGITRDPEGCRLYRLDVSRGVAPQNVHICLREEMPVRLSTETSYGTAILRYRDFNKPIVISR